MTVLITWDVDDREAEEFFDYAGYKTRRMTEPMRKVGDHVAFLILAQFASEGRAMSGGWYPLNEDYRDEKVAEGWQEEILRRSDALLEDATHPSSGYGAVSQGPVKVGNGWLTLDIDRRADDGTDIVELHQQGRPGGTGKHDTHMPARPLWETTQEFELAVEAIFSDWLDELKRTNIRRRGRTTPRPASLQPTYQLEPYLYG